jgi:hypothetical protein
MSKHAGGAADEFVDLVVDTHGNRRRRAITPAHPERVARKPQVERMPSIADAHVEALHFLRQFRIEPENITPHLDARRYTLHQIDRPGHRAEMHALRCGALLNVARVALQRFREEIHRARPVGTRQDPGIDHTG